MLFILILIFLYSNTVQKEKQLWMDKILEYL